jgi:membrane-associated protease RseP (regulator of RpoE activity)
MGAFLTKFFDYRPQRTLNLDVMLPPDPTVLRSLGADHGLFVAGVERDGPAAIGGLKAGDVILSINGLGIWDSKDYTSRLNGFGVGENITITYLRAREEREARVPVAEYKRTQADTDNQAFLRKFYGDPFGPPDAASAGASADAIDRIRAGQYSQMPTAERVGVAGPGASAGMEITNNTAYTILVHFKGPVNRSLRIAPRESAHADLQPGQYEEAAEVLNSNVIPFYGKYSQESGASYRVSFYIAPR